MWSLREMLMRCIKKKSKGFTLIELLIVCSMLAVISLAIYAVFDSGMKIWENISIRVPEEDLNIFFEKFAADLNNCFKFTGIKFVGREERLQFPGLVYSHNTAKRTVGEVAYSYDFAKDTPSREQRDYSEYYNNELPTVTASLKNISMLKFRYYVYDKLSKEYYWQDEWSEENEGLPLAVRMELELNDGTKSRRFVKTVTIPVSN